MHNLNSEQLRLITVEARGWLADAFPRWSVSTIEGMSPSVVRRTVGRHFEGGWEGFVVGSAELAPVYTGYDC